MKSVKLSQALIQASLNGQYKEIRGQEILVDQPTFNFNFAISFYDCSIKFCQGCGVDSLTIFTNQLIRFENSKLDINICVIGQDGGAQFEVLDQRGPSVFFDNCEWNPRVVQLQDQSAYTATPKVQISGFINHFRSKPAATGRLELSILQCRFHKIEISGSYSQIQMVDYIGNAIEFSAVCPEFIWIRDRMIPKIGYIEVDDVSAENISSLFTSRSQLMPGELEVIKNFIEVFSTKKEGKKFLLFNNAYCEKAPTPDPISLMTLKVFRNFYSFKPWLLTAAMVILIFSGLFCVFEPVPLNAVLSSLFSFSGNPTINFNDAFLYSVLKSIEAFLGIFFVIIVSWVLGRKYSNFI